MINQLFNNAIATEQFYECPLCLEPITNPLCHDCIGEQVAAWFKNYPAARKRFMPKLKKYIIEVNNSALAAVNCVSCGKKKAALCPYCFAAGISSLLQRSKIDKNIIADFAAVFRLD